MEILIGACAKIATTVYPRGFIQGQVTVETGGFAGHLDANLPSGHAVLVPTFPIW